MDKRNRDKALNLARKTFGARSKQEQDPRLVPPEVKAEMNKDEQGRKVTPVTKQSVEKDMDRPEADFVLYGTERDVIHKPGKVGAMASGNPGEFNKKYQIDRNAFQSFSNTTKFAVDPNLAKEMGAHTQTFYGKYGNVDIDFTMPFGLALQREGAQYAHMLRNMSRSQNKSIHMVFESWMASNDLRPETVISTARNLRFGSAH